MIWHKCREGTLFRGLSASKKMINIGAAKTSATAKSQRRRGQGAGSSGLAFIGLKERTPELAQVWQPNDTAPLNHDLRAAAIGARGGRVARMISLMPTERARISSRINSPC